MSNILHPWENDQLIGHNQQKKLIINALQCNKFSPIWLFQGSKGIGKATFAFQLTKILLSSEYNNINEIIDFKYNIHDNMVESIKKNECLDLYYIFPNNDNKKTNSDIISIDDIRQLHEFSKSRPTLTKYKIVIIDAIDNLNKNAANALLKLLEDPPGYMIFFMINHEPGRLIDTIKSRSQTLDFKGNNAQEMKELLDIFYPDMSLNIYNNYKIFSPDSLGLFIKFYENRILDKYQILIEKLSDIFKHKINKNIFYYLTENADQEIDLFNYLLNLLIHRYNIFNININENYLEAEKELFQIMQNNIDNETLLDFLFEMNENFRNSSILNLDSRLTLWNNANLIGKLDF